MSNLLIDKPVLTGLDTRSLRERVADLLLNRILSGELRPGVQLVESEIATQLGISRAPVREALQILANSNLVDIVPYRGASVRKLSRVDIDEVYSLRTILEVFALRRAMANDAPNLARRLREVCDLMKGSAVQGDWSGIMKEDGLFHETIIRAANHSLLLTTWSGLNMRVRQIMALRNLQNDDCMKIFYNHLPIVEAIEDGDVEKAVWQLEQHIATAADLAAGLEETIFD